MSTAAPADGPAVAALQPRHPDVFVCYSRENEQSFVIGELVPALTEREKEVWVDLRSVPPAADWRDRVRRGIASARAFVFVLSPDSLKSDECAEELAHALSFKKRLIPVVRRDVEPDDAPQELARRNWIMLRDPTEVAAGLPKLIEALETDLEWRDAHATYTVRAQEWADAQGNLLSGPALKRAELWLSQQGEHRESATREQREFIQESRRVADRRRQFLWISVLLALAVTATLAVVAWLQRTEAVRQADIALARQLVAQAELTREETPELLTRSVLLAVEAVRRAPYPSADTERPLRLGLALLPRQLHRFDDDRGVADIAVSGDGRRVVLGMSDGTVAVRQLASGRELAGWSEAVAIRAVAISDHGDKVAAVTTAGRGSIRHLTGSRRALALRHEGGVTEMEFSAAGGRHLATAGNDRTARLWSTRTGERLAVLRHRYPVTAVAFSEEGRRLATGSGAIPYAPPYETGGSAAVWRVPAGKRLLRLPHREGVNDVAYTRSIWLGPGRDYLATASDDQSARLWNVRSGTGRAVVRHTQSVVAVAFADDGHRLATASFDGTAKVWDATENAEIAVLAHEDQPVGTVAFSPDGRYVATGGADGTARVWEAEGGREVVRAAHPGSVDAVAFARGGRIVVTAAEDHTARAWGARGFARIARLEGWEAFSPGGRYVAEGADDERYEEIWDMGPDRAAARIPAEGFFGIGRPVAFAGNDSRIAVAQHRDEIGVWRLPEGEPVSTVPQRGALDAAALSLDRAGARLAVARGRVATVWNVADQSVARRLPHQRPVLELALSPDGGTLLSVGGDPDSGAHGSEVEVDAIGGGAPARTLRHSGPAQELHFNADGSYFATTDRRGAHLWRTETRDEVGFRPKERIAAFSPDGGQAATVTAGGTIRVREVPGLAEVSEMRHGGFAEVDFSQDGEHLVSAVDATARVWDVATGREVARIPKDTGAALGVTFSGDGRHVVVAEPVAGGYAATTWAWRPDDLIAEACARLSRNLTPEEWRRYLPDEEYRPTCPDLPS